MHQTSSGRRVVDKNSRTVPDVVNRAGALRKMDHLIKQLLTAVALHGSQEPGIVASKLMNYYVSINALIQKCHGQGINFAVLDDGVVKIYVHIFVFRLVMKSGTQSLVHLQMQVILENRDI